MSNRRIYKRYRWNNRITLYEGDCLKLMKQIPSNSVQVIITSPPYNLGKEYESTLTIDKYVNGFNKIIKEMNRILNNNGSICWQVGNYIQNSSKNASIIPLDYIFYTMFNELGYKLRNRIIWSYGHGLHSHKRLSGRYETINWFTKSDNYVFNLDNVRVHQKYPGKRSYRGNNKGKPSGNISGKNPTDFWSEDEIIFKELETDVWKNIPNVKGNHIEKTEHPCQYPIILVSRLVRLLSNMNHLIFDPFVGSGATLVGAIMNGRRAAGAEIHSSYYKIALHNLKKFNVGDLKIREDRPLYKPDKNMRVARIPKEWLKNT